MSIVWVTNLSAPYRRPMWAAFAERDELWVGLLAGSEPNRRWTDDLPEGVRRLPVRALQLRIRDTCLYVLRSRVLTDGECRAVILPGWEHPAAWQLLLEAKLRGKATVAFYESTASSQRHRHGFTAWARRWFFSHVNSVLTVGEASRAAVLEFGVDGSGIVTTRNSVDLSLFAAPSRLEPAPNGPDEQSVSAASGRQFGCVYVGQLIERKNVTSLLRALAELPEPHRLDIVGEGPLESDLISLAAQLDLSHRVRFWGYLQPIEVRQLLGQSSTLVLPSTEEVYGLAPSEALAMGLHAIVSSRAGIAVDIAEMPGVWIVEPEVPAIVAAMRASSVAWVGPINNPEIRQWTAERFADDVTLAVALACQRKSRTS